MNISDRADKAVQLKMFGGGGYNCSQAVTAALADQTGLSEEKLKSVAAGFCAGMGNLEATCGALIGAVMVAGLKTEGKGTLQMARRIQEAVMTKPKKKRRWLRVLNIILFFFFSIS